MTLQKDELKSSRTLSYDHPAREAITEGLPLGNGHLGALVLGGTAFERFVLNESTLSNGRPYDPNHPEALGALPRVRELVFQGDYLAAAALAEQKLMAKPKGQLAYQPLGELFIECPEHVHYSNYVRKLELDTATTTVSYVVDGVRYTREAFISYVDRVLVVRLTASKPSALSCVLRLASEQRGIADWQKGVDCWYGRNTFGMRGRNHEEQGIAGALRFEFAAELRVSDGRVLPGEALLTVRDTTELIIVVAAATSYRAFDAVTADPCALVNERLTSAKLFSYEELWQRHLTDYVPAFERFDIVLGT